MARRVAVDIEQGPCVSILMDPVIAVAQPVGPQNTKVEAVGRGDDLMVPYGRVNVEIEAGDDVVATIYKSNAHEGFLSRRKPGDFLQGITAPIGFLSTKSCRTNLYKKDGDRLIAIPVGYF